MFNRGVGSILVADYHYWGCSPELKGSINPRVDIVPKNGQARTKLARARDGPYAPGIKIVGQRAVWGQT
jgi:hypothetical protein